jgi:hypothetical protein
MLRTRSGAEEMFVDIGTYGTPKVSNFHPIETTRRVEAFVREVNGYLKKKTNCTVFLFLLFNLLFFILQIPNALRRFLHD